jgi:hypothetical protein
MIPMGSSPHIAPGGRGLTLLPIIKAGGIRRENVNDKWNMAKDGFALINPRSSAKTVAE